MLPRTVEDFKKRYAKDVRDPRACVRLWLDVLAKYVSTLPMRIADQMNPAAEMVAACLLNRTGVSAPLPRQWLTRLRAHPYTLWSYLEGAKPENDYAHDLKNMVWAVEPKVETLADRAAVWLRSSGAPDPRRVTLVYRQGSWLIERWEQLFEPVLPPTSAAPSADAETTASEPEPRPPAPQAGDPDVAPIGFEEPLDSAIGADAWDFEPPSEGIGP